MRKHLHITAAVLALALTACSSPWTGNEGKEEGTISISIGSSSDSARAVLPYPPKDAPGPNEVQLSDLEHRIHLQQGNRFVNHTLGKGISSANIKVDTGTWAVTIEAWYMGTAHPANTLYAVGTGNVAVVTGETSELKITMTGPVVGMDDIAVYLAAQADGSTAANPVKLVVKLNLGNTGSTSDWQKLLTAIDTAGKYVDLDISVTASNFSFSPEPYIENPGKDKIVHVTLPANVYHIGEGALANFYNLASVTIAVGVDSIGWGAFSGCEKLTSITIPDSVTQIDRFAFTGTGLASVTIPAGVTYIAEPVFSYCDSLTSISVADGNTNYSSADGVLYNKNKTALLAYPAGKTGTASIPVGILRIGDSALAGCSFTSINIPSSIISIGVNAFSNCENLIGVTIPDSVINIGDYAFSTCSNLTNITIPVGVANIGGGAFAGCIILATISVADGNPNYSSADGVLYNKNKTALLAYPAGKTGTASIPVGVTRIGDSAFVMCNITSITIPAGVTHIGDYTFWVCTSLGSVTFLGTISSANFSDRFPFAGDLRSKYLAGGPGTYTTTAPVLHDAVWTGP